METREERIFQALEETVKQVAAGRRRIDERYRMGIMTGEEALQEKARIMEQGKYRAEVVLQERGIRLTPEERRRVGLDMMEAAGLRRTGTQLVHSPEVSP